MRSFKLGLSRPKSKRKTSSNQHTDDESNSNLDVSEIDEINASRDTIDSISELHLKRNTNTETPSILYAVNTNVENANESVIDLVNKLSIKHDNYKLGAAVAYDLNNKYEPVAGPSTKKHDAIDNRNTSIDYLNDSFESSPEDNKLGIISFYDSSKLFDMSIENKNGSQLQLIEDRFEDEVKQDEVEQDVSVIEENVLSTDSNCQLDFRERSKTPNSTDTKKENIALIFTPKIRPPTKGYIMSTLKRYKIPKTKNPEPYFSNYKDVGEKVEIGHMILKLQSKVARDQKPFERVLDVTSIEEWRQLMFIQTNEVDEDSAKPEVLKKLLAGNKHCTLKPVKTPPTRNDVLKWLKQKDNQLSETKVNIVDQTEISKNGDELDNSQAIGLNEDEINSSISLEASDKVRF